MSAVIKQLIKKEKLSWIDKIENSVQIAMYDGERFGYFARKKIDQMYKTALGNLFYKRDKTRQDET